MRKAQVIMGTGVTVDIPAANQKKVFDRVFARLKEIDRRFSTYKKNSEVSRYGHGELKWWRMSRELRKVIKACQNAEKETDGAFSAYYDMPVSHLDAAQGNSDERTKRTTSTKSEQESVVDTVMRQEPHGAFGSAGRQAKAMRRRHFDPSGYVKGWAVSEGAKIIEKNGFDTYCISIGGDIYASGDKVWRIGVQDPKNKMRSLLSLNIQNKGVATSGNYVRGSHIINPKTKKPANELLSLTVVGPSIIDADVLATAAYVLGDFGIRFISGQAKGYEALAINKNGHIEMTKGFSHYLDKQP